MDANGRIIHVSPNDNYHPDTVGYNLMADTWAAALLQAAPVPEPSALLLLGIGTLGLIGWTGRRQDAQRDGSGKSPIKR